uniref:uncharacterized protein n=1 Tax=Semicossyphus pulcher TaxID=241346 RepID=UPI0037E82EE5
MDEQVNPLDTEHCLSVVLPGGLEKTATVHGSKPVMDLLVTLCASYHLNPSDYTVEFLSANKNNIRFKPNSPIGSLEAEKIVLKPKGMEEKIRRPYMPEPSVRLLINYNKSHKAVVRVNPKVPLEMLLPAMCEKCEFQVETTVLLRDSQSTEPLDLSKSLNDHGLREVFAKDTAVEHQHQPKTAEKAVTPTEVISPPPLEELPKKEKKQKENTGFLSLFRRRKKKTDMEGTGSAPGSPGLKVGVSTNVQSVSSSSNTLTADMRKKRPAPQPPMGVSQSVPNNLSTCHLRGAQRSADSTLRSTKRRAPPPPCANNHGGHSEVKGTIDSLYRLEELRESDEYDSISFSSSSSPHPSRSHSSSSFSRPSLSHLHEAADQYLPSLRGKDLSDARCALAKVLTSSISRGALVKRLRNSANIPKLNNSSSLISKSHRGSENGVYCGKLEPVLATDLPTEPEWEDPVQRRLMTTFKVVPAKKQTSTDAEISLNVPETITIEDYSNSEPSSELLRDQTDTEEDPCCPSLSPEGSSQEASNLPNPPLPPLDLDKNTDGQSSSPSEVGDTVEREEEEEPEREEEEPETEEEPKREEEEPEKEEEEPKMEEEEPERAEEEEPERAEEEAPERAEEEPERAEEEEPERAEEEEPERAEEEPERAEEEEPERAEEEEPEATSEVEQAAEGLHGEGQISPEDQNELLQSPSRECVRTDTDHCATNAEQTEDEEEEDDCFPPPPPPVFYNEDIEVFEERTSSSLPSNGQMKPSNEDLQDNRSSAPSGFAQAVALAVQRSRIPSHGKSLSSQAPSGPHSTHPSSPRSLYQFGA